MAHQKHILIVLRSCRGRTIGDYALLRARYFSKWYKVTVVSDSFPDEVDSSINTIQVDFRQFGYLRRFAHVPNDYSFVNSAKRALQKYYETSKFDFILCHSYSIAFFVGGYFKKNRNIPYGMFMHGHIFTRPPGTYDQLTTLYYRKLAPNCYKNSDVIFALSKEQARLAIKSGATHGRVKHCPNGFELRDLGISSEEVERKSSLRFLDPTTRLLYVGRFSREKGFDVLLDACEILSARNFKFRLDIVGAGMMDQADINKFDNSKIHFHANVHGAVSRNKLGTYYLDADVVCVPSRDEPLGNVVLEGMASGCIVIASNTGGIPEIIEHGQSGILFENENADDLAGQIISCAVDINLRMSKNGQSQVRDKFHWPDILNKMQQDIAHVMDEDIDEAMDEDIDEAMDEPMQDVDR